MNGKKELLRNFDAKNVPSDIFTNNPIQNNFELIISVMKFLESSDFS